MEWNLFGVFIRSGDDDCEDVIVGDDDDDDDVNDADDHSLSHLNSFMDHHGVSIRADAAVDCFMKLFVINHQGQVTNVII